MACGVYSRKVPVFIAGKFQTHKGLFNSYLWQIRTKSLEILFWLDLEPEREVSKTRV